MRNKEKAVSGDTAFLLRAGWFSCAEPAGSHYVEADKYIYAQRVQPEQLLTSNRLLFLALFSEKSA